MEKINRLIIQEIPIDELTESDLQIGMTTDRHAEILFPDNSTLAIPSEGGVFDVSGYNLYNGSWLNAKLWIYDRQTPSIYFTVIGRINNSNTNNTDVATIKFVQQFPAIAFHLVNV